MLPWCHLSLCPMLFYNPTELMYNQVGPCLFKTGQNSGQEGLTEGDLPGQLREGRRAPSSTVRASHGKKVGDCCAGTIHHVADRHRELSEEMGKLDSEHAYVSCSPCSSLARNTKVPMSASRRCKSLPGYLLGNIPRSRASRLPTDPSLLRNLSICKVIHSLTVLNISGQHTALSVLLTSPLQKRCQESEACQRHS